MEINPGDRPATSDRPSLTNRPAPSPAWARALSRIHDPSSPDERRHGSAASGGGRGGERRRRGRRDQGEEATDRLRDFDASIRARPEGQRPREAPPGHPGSRGGGARAGSATAEQQAYWWGPGGPKVNDRDLLEFDLFVEMHLRQEKEEQLLLPRLQRPAAARTGEPARGGGGARPASGAGAAGRAPGSGSGSRAAACRR